MSLSGMQFYAFIITLIYFFRNKHVIQHIMSFLILALEASTFSDSSYNLVIT